jgi:hypothetical protein
MGEQKAKIQGVLGCLILRPLVLHRVIIVCYAARPRRCRGKYSVGAQPVQQDVRGALRLDEHRFPRSFFKALVDTWRMVGVTTCCRQGTKEHARCFIEGHTVLSQVPGGLQTLHSKRFPFSICGVGSRNGQKLKNLDTRPASPDLGSLTAQC